ncbi:hypothetical protein RclHR1_00100010 [Rhizophagus clarus]|uniref:Protein kinase domain-containing protein n=1 Tax=Rhizophagus clarus TaxID=94130 RepID=A0A2Z6QSD4_9GLOM|nr:hypothetical protein RclHR1_00100010 [Rhizophagus clarus]
MPRLISIILGLCHFIIKISIVLIVLFFSIIYQFLNKCKICGNEYTNIEKWCKPCQINNLTKFFTNSEIEKIGRLIQEMQRNIDRPSDIIFEWIPYDQFENIKELDKSVNVHSAIWKDGPLYYKDRIIFSEKKYVREQNKSVILKCLYNSRIITNVFLNEVKLYHSKNNNNHHMPRLYGITQDPKTKDYILIDGIIQQMRLNYNNLNDILFEWIPYDQFNNVNVIIRENELVTIYSAIWSNGPLHYDIHKSKYMRNKNEKVLLKCLFNSHNILDKFLNELKASSHKIYGVSQDPDTNDYIIVFIDGFHCQNCGKLFTQVYNKWSIWKDGPLYYDNNKYEYARKQNTKIILKHLCNSRNITNAFLNKIESYYLSNHNSYMPEVLYGISRNPDTKDYILVFKTTAIRHAVKIFTNWTSGNEKIDDLIQEMQLSFNEQSDVLFEWIPYNQFNNVKVIRDDEFSTTRSAIWSDGPLYYDTYKFKYTRNKNESVILKSPHNSQNIDEFLNEIKSSPLKMYGISQNSDSNYFIVVRDECRCDKCGKLFTDTNLKLCKPCQRRCLKNITIWTSRNEKINKLIQKIQSKINMAFEWIPYNQFKNVKEIGKNVRVNKAIWRDGPLYYDNIKGEYERSRNEEVYLKCLYGSRNFTHISDIFLNEVTSYYSNNQYYSVPGIYGISQNPVTNDYMLVFQYCKPIAIRYTMKILTNWISENIKIDELIQKMQLKINEQGDTVFEWIPYNQFNNIEIISNDETVTIYSAVWKDGPLYYYYNNEDEYEFKRNQNKKVNLKRLDEIELASLIKTYGVTQKSDTKDYFIVFQNECDCEKCGKVFTDILSGVNHVNKPYDMVFEWIPYNQFYNIEKIGISVRVCSAIWKDGPLYYDNDKYEYTRCQNEVVALKCLYNSQNIVNVVLNEIRSYSIKNYLKTLSENEITTFSEIEVITLSENEINTVKILTNWISGNEKIDYLIQELQSKINKLNNIIFEWIPYDQFIDIKEIECIFPEVYSATWKDGPLYYRNQGKSKYTRRRNKRIVLKFLNNSQNITNVFLSEIKSYYLINHDYYNIPILYGISQNPNTKDYILVFQYYETIIKNKHIIKILTNWTSGNEKIDDLIKEMQSKINKANDIIFEWIPYKQFDIIKKIGVGGFSKVYSAIWKDGLLYYDGNKYVRKQEKKVALKCLNNSQNITS